MGKKNNNSECTRKKRKHKKRKKSRYFKNIDRVLKNDKDMSGIELLNFNNNDGGERNENKVPLTKQAVNNDDIPSTSHSTHKKSKTFKKILDNSTRNNKSLNKSASQYYYKRVKRTMMNRSLRRMQNRKDGHKHNKQKFKKILDTTVNSSAMKRSKPNISVRKNLKYTSNNSKENIIDDDCMCVEPEVVSIDLENYNLSTDKNFLSSTPISSGNNNEMNTPDKHFFEEKRPKWWIDITGDRTLTNIDSPDILSPNKDSTKYESAQSHFNAEDIIVLDETFEDSTLENKTLRAESDDDDDSVLFVSDSRSPTFIPLVSDRSNYTNSPPQYVINCARAKIVQNNSLFTRSEKKKLQQYNTNAYNPGTVEHLRKRMVIIDGSNVAYSHSRNREFSVRGLKICLDYFENMGHRVKAVVPQFRLQKYKSSDPASLAKYYENGKIVFTPCKNLPGKTSNSYDDRFILQLAAEQDAVIISNDNYRDLINENIAFKKLIENRVLGYTWCDDIFMLPKDPYGRFGPSLDSILNRKI